MEYIYHKIKNCIYILTPNRNIRK